MSGLPNGWVETSLNEVADWGSGGTPKAGTAAYYGGSIPWAVIGDLTDGFVSKTASTITEAGLANSSAKIVDADAVLIAMYGSIGKLGLPTISMATNQAIAFARPYDGLMTREYLFYYLMNIRQVLAAAGKGATQRNISQTILKAWPISVAPLPEQMRIVAALEEQFSRLDAGVASLQHAGQKLKRMRSTVLQAAVTGQLLDQDPAEGTGIDLLARIAKERGGAKPPVVASADLAVPKTWAVTSLACMFRDLGVVAWGCG